eukprot:1729690-Prymnesium_polylepis.1
MPTEARAQLSAAQAPAMGPSTEPPTHRNASPRCPRGAPKVTSRNLVTRFVGYVVHVAGREANHNCACQGSPFAWRSVCRGTAAVAVTCVHKIQCSERGCGSSRCQGWVWLWRLGERALG